MGFKMLTVTLFLAAQQEVLELQEQLSAVSDSDDDRKSIDLTEVNTLLYGDK